LSLGIVWWLVSKKDANNDGKHDGYLDLKFEIPRERFAAAYRNCDPDLYDALRRMRQTKKLCVQNIRTSSLFADDSRFFEETLSYDDVSWSSPVIQERRERYRREWLMRALSLTQKCQLVFVDPDNGLESQSTRMHHARGPKYVYLDELAQFYERSQSLV